MLGRIPRLIVVSAKALAAACSISLLFVTRVDGDVKFTAPAAGADVPVGTIRVQWEESGVAPRIQDLTAFTLDLMTGGNSDADMLSLTTFESQGSFSTGNEATGTIPSGIAGSATNGFFFRIVSTVAEGGTVINYSSRFTITGLTGSTPFQYRQAAESFGNTTTGPDTVDDIANSTSTATSTARSSSATVFSSSTLIGSTSTTVVATKGSAEATSTAASTSFSSPSTSSNLSTAAQVGIAVACTIAGVAFIASIIALILARKRRRTQANAPENPFLDDKAELSAEQMTQHSPIAVSELSGDHVWQEAGGHEVIEAGSGERLPELDHTAVRAELEGSQSGTPM
jgi:hypothetical protein